MLISPINEIASDDTRRRPQKRTDIERVREVQKKRFGENKMNSDMNVRDIEEFVELGESVQETLNAATKKLDLSPRAYHRVIKLARTIADLDESGDIEESHILEALQYRPKQISF